MRPESRSIMGAAGSLDTRWHGPRDGRPLVLLHPHPLLGGTMGSRLVYDLAVGLAADGWRVVRFDFRGVGRSEGTYGDGLGETADALAVLAAVEAEAAKRAVLVGYSFGGAVACRAASMHAVDRLLMVAAPSNVMGTALDVVDDAPRVSAPAHLVVGDRDPYVSVESARAMAAAFRPPAGLTVLPAAGHFLEPQDNPRVLAAVQAALR
ncbi:MAG: alpha/beta hydrolase [Thermoplasmatota archaeon]